MKKKADRRQTDAPHDHRVDRRTFVKMLPAVGVAGLAAPRLDDLFAEAAQQQQSQTSQRVTKEMMHAAKSGRAEQDTSI